LKRLTGIQQGPLRNSYPGLYNSTPVNKWQVATAIVAPIWAPGVPEEETVAIVALNRNCMKIMWLVTVTLPVGWLLYRGKAMNTGPFSISTCFAPSMVWILEKLDSLLLQAD